MSERRNIVELAKGGDAVALITLVRVEGSSYRRPGARLLITHHGDYAGSISGGCLEAELIRKAMWKVGHGAVVERYSTLFDDTADMPYGLGCGGTVDLLLEPANTAEFSALIDAMEASLAGGRSRVVTQLPSPEAKFGRWIFDAQGRHIFSGGHGAIDEDAPFYAEEMLPPPRLIVFGAGDDAKPLVTGAATLGWRVAVVDGRSQWACPERFPGAQLVGTDLHALEVAEDDVVAIMTHSYEQDRAYLVHALPRQPRYLGLLGAKHRSALLLGEAATQLGWELADVCGRVFAPMGLDLGGDGAEAVALAALAEMQACVEGKLAVPRRISAEVVRALIAEGGASRYLQAQCAL